VVLSVSNTGVGCLKSRGCLPQIPTQDHGIGTTLIRELVRQIEGEFILMQDITGTTAGCGYHPTDTDELPATGSLPGSLEKHRIRLFRFIPTTAMG
jgi:hypothetical protein